MICPGAGARRVALIARGTVRDGVRRRFSLLLFGCGAAGAGGGRLLRAFNFGVPEAKFICDFGQGCLLAAGSVFTVVLSVQTLLGEWESRSAVTLLAKPVRRSEYLLGKYLGVLGLILCFCTVLTAMIALGLASAPGGDAGESGKGLLVAAAGHVLRFSVLAAFTFLIATYARSAASATLLSLGVLAVCQLQHLAQDAAATAVAGSLRWPALVARCCPNFQVFDLTGLAGSFPGGDRSLLASVAAYALWQVAGAGLLAVFSFRHREI